MSAEVLASHMHKQLIFRTESYLKQVYYARNALQCERFFCKKFCDELWSYLQIRIWKWFASKLTQAEN